MYFGFFFFNDTATTEIYTLSLHDALPICGDEGDPGARGGVDAADDGVRAAVAGLRGDGHGARPPRVGRRDRKSTRLNSSHANISYAVFCLKKKNKIIIQHIISDLSSYTVL